MTIKVLLVEDSALAREKVSGILGELGCEVVCAEDGVAGLKTAQKHAAELDLVILDIQMPKADGITLLRYLRKLPNLADTPIVMLTTQADQETVRRALSHGAKDFLRKDATITHITERLQHHVEQIRSPAPSPATRQDPEQVVHNLLMGSSMPEMIEGPCVVCHLPEAELGDLAGPSSARQRDLYAGIASGVGEIQRRFPELKACYAILSAAPEVNRVLQNSTHVPWVLLLGRRTEALALAKMIGLAGLARGRVLHMICDPIAALDERDRDSVTRMGAQLIERREFDGKRTFKLLEKHLLPAASATASGVRFHELTRGTRDAPREGQKARVHYTAVRADGQVAANTFVLDRALEVPTGDASLPAGVWEVLAQLGMGGQALIELPEAGPDEALYYQVNFVEVIDL